MTDETIRQPVALVEKSEGGDTDADQAETTPELAPDDASDAVVIALGKAITINGPGATTSGNTVNITGGGTYRISGTLTDGQISVNTKEKVTLELAGMSVTNSAGPALNAVDAKKITLKLLPGTTNYFADSAQEQAEDAAVVTNDTLVIEGDGALVVTGNNGEGIASDDDIIIKGGTITVTAVDDGLDAHDNITIAGGHVSITGGGDGIKAGQDANPEVGSIAIEGGTIEITAARDGIQAATTITITAGDLTISTGGGSASATARTAQGGRVQPGAWGQQASDTPSAKGIKAVNDLVIAGGTITIDAADDALHSNDSLTINGGSLTLASGDDAIHADASVTINGGDIRITTSYEGIESAIITINDGNIRLVSSDDGINAVSDNAAAGMAGPWGRNPFNESGNNNLYINGGYIVIDANGDGLDINGSIEMTGGQVIINGPTRNDNGALDYLGTFKITSGLLVAAGSVGMAQAPSTSSAQYSVMVNLNAAQPAGTVFHIATQDGRQVLTFVPTKAYQSVVFSSPELKRGATYVVYTGGKVGGTATDGLYAGGAYTPGTQLTSLTISSAVTVVGSSRGIFPGGRRP